MNELHSVGICDILHKVYALKLKPHCASINMPLE
jgi:hypothetical protein